MSISSVYTFIIATFWTLSAFLLFKSGAMLAQLRRWRPVATLWLLCRAFVPMWFVQHLLVVRRRRGRSTRLARKRYRSLRRRALRRGVDEFFRSAELVPVDPEQLSLAIVCALAGCAVIVLTVAGTENHWPWW